MDAYIPPALGRYSKANSGATTAYAYDAGITFYCTGTFTLTLDVPANLGANWTCCVMNIGVGVITVDAQAAHIKSAKGLSAHTDDVASGSGQIFGTDGTDFAVLSTNYNETGNATWGAITGTLALQTDLQAVLDAKVDETISVTGTGMLAGGGTLTANQAITLASAAGSTILGNNTGGSAVPIAMTVAQTKTLLAYTPADIGAEAKTLTVSAKTSDYGVQVADTTTVFTNTGASGTVIFTLPAAAVGLRYTFVVAVNAKQITVARAGSDIIYHASATQYKDVYSAAISASITICCYATGLWVSTSAVNTWNGTTP